MAGGRDAPPPPHLRAVLQARDTRLHPADGRVVFILLFLDFFTGGEMEGRVSPGLGPGAVGLGELSLDPDGE